MLINIKVQELLNIEKKEIIFEHKENLNHKECGSINEEIKHLGDN